MKKFWMVCSSASNSCQVKHETKEKAVDEAKRLAETNPGKVFHVLECVGYWFTPPAIKFSEEYE